jgi:type II secretory pathway pseudopilin PulG
MAALLVGLAVMAVLMSVALPVWRQQSRRQKEDELIWRGNQYVRAIRLYQAKFASLPPGVDILVDGHFLRKKFKDPITNDDFDLLGAGSGQPGLPAGRGQAAPGAPGQTTTLTTTSAMGTPQVTSQPTASTSGAAASGGIVPGGLTGVRSKSKDESIKIYQGRTHYNEWVFMFVGQTPGIGTGGAGRGTPGGPGGTGPGGRGVNGPGGGGINGPGGRGINGPGRGAPFGPGNPPPGFPPNFPSPGRRGGGL